MCREMLVGDGGITAVFSTPSKAIHLFVLQVLNYWIYCHQYRVFVMFSNTCQQAKTRFIILNNNMIISVPNLQLELVGGKFTCQKTKKKKKGTPLFNFT